MTSLATSSAARRSAALAEALQSNAPNAGAQPAAAGSAPSDGPEITAAPAVAEASIEEVIACRAAALLARIGDSVPDLHAAVLQQAERGLFRAVLAHTGNHLGRASQILGLDRNTCARKARQFGLVEEPSRGRKPSPARKRALPAKRRRSGRRS